MLVAGKSLDVEYHPEVFTFLTCVSFKLRINTGLSFQCNCKSTEELSSSISVTVLS